MRRLVAVLALVVALGALTTAARAQDSNGYSGGWTDPASTTTNDNGWPVVYLDAAQALSGQVTHANGIQRVTAVLVPDPDNPPPDGCDPSMDPVTAEQDGTTVTFHVNATFPCDITYQVKATAYAAAGGALRSTPPPYQMPLEVAVAIPPAPVGTVTATASADGNNRAVKLEWPANSEPDLLGYVIQRTAHDKTTALGQVKAGDTLEYVDHQPSSGTSNRYDIIAVRSGPDSTIKQVASEPTSVAVDVASRDTAGGGGTGGGSESGLTTVVTGKPSTGKPDSQQLLSSVRAKDGGGKPSSPPTTFDSGFQGTLPFKTGGQSASAAPTGGEPAVVATFDEGGGDSFFGNKGAMTLIAGGLAILIGAAVIFYVSRRAAADAY